MRYINSRFTYLLTYLLHATVSIVFIWEPRRRWTLEFVWPTKQNWYDGQIQQWM